MKCLKIKSFYPAILISALAFSFVSCVKMVEVEKPVEVEKTVEIEKPVYISGTTVEDATKVLHFKQTVDTKSYVLAESEEKDVAAHTEMKSIAKDYEGFTPSTITQKGDVAYIFYDRNIISHTFSAGEGTFDDGSSVKVVKGVYGSSYEKTIRPSYQGYRFTKWLSQENKAPDWTFGLTDESYFAQWLDKGLIGEDFVYISGTSIKGDEVWTPASLLFASGKEFEINDFIMCTHEVTRGEYDALKNELKNNGEYDKYKHLFQNINTAITSGDASKNPVSTISWYETLVYCNLRSMSENMTPCYTINGSTDPADWGAFPTASSDGWKDVICDYDADGYRLPTEAEWEYAARANSTYKFSGSDNISEVAIYTVNSGKTSADKATSEVCSLAANDFGLYDMSGNVWEYCQEKGSDSTKRVTRGGSYQTDMVKCGVGVVGDVATKDKCSYHETDPVKPQNNFGFRVVRGAN